MKNQPNKDTVKDGLPTAEQIIREKIKEHSASTVKINVEDVPVFTHFLFVAIEAMQSYSDQQNAELREKIFRLAAMHDELDVENAKLRERLCQREECIDVIEERVKELEALMQEFVDRVDLGEVRSKRTYAKFKEALNK